MKGLLQLATTCLVLVSSSLFANTQQMQDLEITNSTISRSIKDSFGYVSIGVEPLFSALSFGFGYRIQKTHHGLDISTAIAWGNLDYPSCLESLNDVKRKASFLYNFFFLPYLSSQIYVGLGFAVNYIGVERYGSIVGFSPEFVFGKQYKNGKKSQRFIQIQISWPVFYIKSKKIASHSDYYIAKVKASLESSPLFTLFYGIAF